MIYKLSELAQIKYGKDHKKLSDGTIPVFGTGGLMRSVDNSIYEGESVLIPRKGSLNNVQFVSGKFWTVDTLFYTIVNETQVLPKFLFYLIKSINLSEMNVGSAVPSMTTEVLNDLEFNVPSKQIQEKIIKVIQSIENKIELNNQINDNLLEISQQLFIEYFNDLDEANDVKLSEICIIKYGKNLPTKKIISSGYPVYGGNGIIGYYNEKMYTRSQVLISCRGAASGKALFTKPNCFVTNNSLILECDDRYYHYLKEFSLLNNYYQYATGSAQPQITIENIKDIKIKIPNDEILNKYNLVFNSLESQYIKNVEQIETLTQLRDTLLPKLMNGEIDLENIEI